MGQSVRFTPDRNTYQGGGGAYTVVKTLPESAGVPQYRVKPEFDGCERVVHENQLDSPA